MQTNTVHFGLLIQRTQHDVESLKRVFTDEMNASELNYFQFLFGDRPAGTGAGDFPTVGKDDDRCQTFADEGRGGGQRDLPDVVLDEKWELFHHGEAPFLKV